MFRRTKTETEHDGEGGHSGRPWVYFMVDCFLLMTNFFIITFQFKVQEPILPQKLPPMGGGITKVPPPPRSLVIHCRRVGEQAVYEYQSRQVNLSEVSRTLADIAQEGGKYVVKVSYSDDAQWQDVLDVFNECNKYRIEKCGLVPSRN